LVGGCKLNRTIPELIKYSGFKIEKMKTRYLPQKKLLDVTINRGE